MDRFERRTLSEFLLWASRANNDIDFDFVHSLTSNSLSQLKYNGSKLPKKEPPDFVLGKNGDTYGFEVRRMISNLKGGGLTTNVNRLGVENSIESMTDNLRNNMNLNGNAFYYRIEAFSLTNPDNDLRECIRKAINGFNTNHNSSGTDKQIVIHEVQNKNANAIIGAFDEYTSCSLYREGRYFALISSKLETYKDRNDLLYDVDRKAQNLNVADSTKFFVLIDIYIDADNENLKGVSSLEKDGFYDDFKEDWEAQFLEALDDKRGTLKNTSGNLPDKIGLGLHNRFLTPQIDWFEKVTQEVSIPQKHKSFFDFIFVNPPPGVECGSGVMVWQKGSIF